MLTFLQIISKKFFFSLKVKFYWISLQISIQDSIYTHCFCCNESQEAMKYPLYDLKNAAVHSILFSNSLHQQFCSQGEQKWIEPIVGTTCSWIILSCSHNSALRFSWSEAFCTPGKWQTLSVCCLSCSNIFSILGY